MKLTLANRMNVMKSIIEKANEAVKKRILNDAVVKSVLTSTKNYSEAQGKPLKKSNKEGSDTRNIDILDNAVPLASQEQVK